jgi:hypothetical protein
MRRCLAPKGPAEIRRQPHAQFDTIPSGDGVDPLDISGMPNNAFGRAEADREVFQIRGVSLPARA